MSDRRGAKYVLPVVTTIGGLVALVGGPVGTLVGGAIVLLAGGAQIWQLIASDRDARRRAAVAHERVCTATRSFETQVLNAPSFGDTSVLVDALQVQLGRLAEDILGGRFDFRAGRRQFEWEKLGRALRSAGIDFAAATAAISGMSSTDADAVADIVDGAPRAARRALAVASAYAGFPIDEHEAGERYRQEDQKVDLGMLAAYGDLGGDLATIDARIQTICGAKV